MYLKIYKWILGKKKTSKISVFFFEANSSSLVIMPNADTFDNEALRAKMLLFKRKKTKKATNKFGNVKEDSKKFSEIPILVAFWVWFLIYNQTSRMLLDYLKTFEFRKPTSSEYKTSSGYRNESWKDLEKEKCLKNNPSFSLKS